MLVAVHSGLQCLAINVYFFVGMIVGLGNFMCCHLTDNLSVFINYRWCAAQYD
jgi:hypothetical protein